MKKINIPKLDRVLNNVVNYRWFFSSSFYDILNNFENEVDKQNKYVNIFFNKY